MINNVVLVGRTTKDVELRNDKNGEHFAFITLALNIAKDTAIFVDCLFYKQNADNADLLLCKGSLVGVQGMLTQRSYLDGNNKKITETFVRVRNFDLLANGKPNDTDIVKNNKGTHTVEEIMNEEISDDDLPF